jgi:hypothetical protein
MRMIWQGDASAATVDDRANAGVLERRDTHTRAPPRMMEYLQLERKLSHFVMTRQERSVSHVVVAYTLASRS